MKFVPFALCCLSNFGSTPYNIEGVLLSSSSVNNHWLESDDAIVKLAMCSPRSCGFCGGESLDTRGGDGTAGGIFAMDFEVGWDRRASEGASGGKMCVGR
jgi:hypothetical protein